MKRSVAAFILLLWTLVACQGAFSTPIRKIVDNPRDYASKTVTVSGEVKEVFDFFFMKYFVLNDGTGEMTVVTKKPLPAKGTKVLVKGKVNELFTLGDTATLVIVEEDDSKLKIEQ